MAVYTLSGTRADFDPTNLEARTETLERFVSYDANVRSVNHRGYSTVAPENTLPAYILSKKMGFNYAECDVSFTSDSVAVLLHDSTIDRTSDGSGKINEMTFAQARQYDFGSWKSAAYTGTQIPSFEEFIQLCKRIMLHPYIELKPNNYTQAQVESIVDMVHATGMDGKVTYISYSDTYLGYVKTYDASARLGWLRDTASSSDITALQGLKTTSNEVFLNAYYGSVTQSICTAYAAAGIPIEVWTVNSESAILSMNNYVSGITSDSLNAGKILYETEMS